MDTLYRTTVTMYIAFQTILIHTVWRSKAIIQSVRYLLLSQDTGALQLFVHRLMDTSCQTGDSVRPEADHIRWLGKQSVN